MVREPDGEKDLALLIENLQVEIAVIKQECLAHKKQKDRFWFKKNMAERELVLKVEEAEEQKVRGDWLLVQNSLLCSENLRLRGLASPDGGPAHSGEV